jgi:hypothetical protein
VNRRRAREGLAGGFSPASSLLDLRTPGDY